MQKYYHYKYTPKTGVTIHPYVASNVDQKYLDKVSSCGAHSYDMFSSSENKKEFFVQGIRNIQASQLQKIAISLSNKQKEIEKFDKYIFEHNKTIK